MVINSASGQKVFVSWSGGKDSYLALLLAAEQGLDITCLLCFTGEDGSSRSHGLKIEMLRKQAEALGLPLVTKEVTWETYEQGFEEAVHYLKKEMKTTGGVFGDINLAEHRQWVEKMSNRCAIDYNLPLWQMEERKVSEELICRGGKAVVVAIRSDLVDEKWLGRFIGEDFIDYCISKNISPCGEGGEAHTLVVGGPLFNEAVSYISGEIKRQDNRALLEISSD